MYGAHPGTTDLAWTIFTYYMFLKWDVRLEVPFRKMTRFSVIVTKQVKPNSFTGEQPPGWG